MKYKTFAVYDIKAHAYTTPFFYPEQGQAIRMFSDCINNPDHSFSKHPEDYALYNIGAYDDTKGQIIGQDPIFISQGVEYIQADETPGLFDAIKKEEIL